jgi:hypothetical protein
MKNGRILVCVAAIGALVSIGLQVAPAGAAPPTFFGAKLTTHSQPSNAEDGYSCDESAHIPNHATCTWVATEAFENGSNFTAPTTGTILHVSLISCVAGSFTLQVAQAKPSQHKAQIVADGPVINYAGQNGCGHKFTIQTFPVSVPVTKGDYMAIETPSTGALSCSGGSGVMLFAPPLSAGGPLTKTKAGASCDLLVSYSYV